jgi:hypothetical protein
MQEFNISIEIDEDGNIKADTKGMKGEVCVDELKNILKGLEGDQTYKNKPEFYSENKSRQIHIINEQTQT